MGEVIQLRARHVSVVKEHQERQRKILAQVCCDLFDKYYEYEGETRREFGRELLIALMNFLQTDNVVRGRPEEEGLDTDSYLVLLRKVFTGEDVYVIPPLPQEVYAALP